MDEHYLIFKSQQGDLQAFEELIAAHRQPILRHCAHTIQDDALAEDIMQDACIKAFNKLASFKEQAAFGTWLWRIAHNLCLDYLRKKKLHPEGVFEESLNGIRDIDPSLLNECLEHLPTKHRKVFELFYVEQLSQKEIADRLAIPYGTVRSRLYYAKKKLRKFFS